MAQDKEIMAKVYAQMDFKAIADEFTKRMLEDPLVYTYICDRFKSVYDIRESAGQTPIEAQFVSDMVDILQKKYGDQIVKSVDPNNILNSLVFLVATGLAQKVG